jgi:four helix bundle protein
VLELVLVLVLVLVLDRKLCVVARCRFHATGTRPMSMNMVEVNTMRTEPAFDHEKLDVYRLAIEFARWVGEMLDGPLQPYTAKSLEHLDESSRSIARNIAEGNGKRSTKDRCRFLDIARGSALECAACLDILIARKRLDLGLGRPGKAMLVRIVSMLVKLTQKLLHATEMR